MRETVATVLLKMIRERFILKKETEGSERGNLVNYKKAYVTH